MSAFAPKIEFAMTRNFAFVELESELDQILNSRRRFGHDRPDDIFIAQTRARFERVAHVKLERVFITRHAGDSALRPRGVRVLPLSLGDHGDRSVLRRFQGEA